MKKALVFLAEGFEEVEALTPVDYLRRAGIEVQTAAVGKTSGLVTGAHGISVKTDATLEGLIADDLLTQEGWAAVLLPGGMPGSSNLAACAELGDFLIAMAAAGKLVAAICAAPAVVLAPLGLLKGKRFTCYPGMEDNVPPSSGAQWSSDPVVRDGRIITSRAAGTAGLWAAAIVEALEGQKAAADLLKAVLLTP
ncbi:DJ-1 family glyoxalase III [Breznakiellaceae bacterium SP9]